jgi:ubiquinone biosynthesis protein UbiJ
MATQSPFSMLQSFLQDFKFPFTLPAWVVDESQRRVVLLINHVLMQEPQATARLARQRGRAIMVQWKSLNFKVVLTPAGLLDLAPHDAVADLVLTLTDVSPAALVQGLLQSGKPEVHIQGDVQLAAEVNWITDHVRWDAEADLARIVGDVPAHLVVENCRKLAQGLQHFVAQRRNSSTPTAPTESSP